MKDRAIEVVNRATEVATGTTDRLIEEIVARAKDAHTTFRSYTDTAVQVPGGMFAHVRDGRLIGFGVEPVGDAIIDTEGHLRRTEDGNPGQVLWGRVAGVAAAGASAVAGTVGAVAWGVLRRKPAAA